MSTQPIQSEKSTGKRKNDSSLSSWLTTTDTTTTHTTNSNRKKPKRSIATIALSNTNRTAETFWKVHNCLFTSDKSRDYYQRLSKMVQSIVDKEGRPTIQVYGKSVLEPRLKAYFSEVDESYVYSGTAQVSHGWPVELQELEQMAHSLVLKENPITPSLTTSCSTSTSATSTASTTSAASTASATNAASAASAANAASADAATRTPAMTSTKTRFPRALVNYYRNGQDNIGAHRDSDAMDGYIVSFTFYEDNTPPNEKRKFVIRDNDINHPPVHSSNGDIVVEIWMEQGSAIIMKPGMQRLFKHQVPPTKKAKKGRINVTFRERQIEKDQTKT